jgi:hypothetical protein
MGHLRISKMSDENLKLWNSVCKTDPAFTKKANVKGNRITSIAPQYQIMLATSEFGSYGSTWGFRETNIDYSLLEKGLILFTGVFYYPSGNFPINNSISIYKDNAQTKIDDDFAKKVETDTLTKALSKIGFNADVFMGRFDDARYVDEVNDEFAQKKNLEELKKNPEIKVILEMVEEENCDFIRDNWGGTIKENWLNLPSKIIDSLNHIFEKDAEFQANFTQYEDAIKNGNKTPETLIKYLESKGPVLNSHKMKLMGILHGDS